jgi:hypothetical protein
MDGDLDDFIKGYLMSRPNAEGGREFSSKGSH